MSDGARRKGEAVRLPEAPRGSFSRLYGFVTGRAHPVREAGVAPAETPLREKVIRCLWYDQFLDLGALRTEDGRRLAVHSPGYWNEGAGPDFRNAEFAFDDGPRVRGDVELHVAASDWKAHGHDGDPAYGGVRLHVVLHNDLGAAVVTHNGRPIPQLAMERNLSLDLKEILGSLDPDGYPRAGCGREGACCRSLRAAGRSDAWIGRFLDIAGDERMLRKAERFGTAIARATPDEVMYASLMETMGYSANRRGFRKLASSVPLSFLRKRVPLDADPAERLLWTQAALFGAAGFLEGAAPLSDAEADAMRADLWARWERLSAGGGPERLTPSDWNLARTRPTNHPLRRAAGFSAFLAMHLEAGLCRAMLSAVEGLSPGDEGLKCRGTLARFGELIESQPQPFWARRTGFRPPCLPRPTALIGAARTTEMIVNVVVPLLLALTREADHARVERRLHNVYCSLRPLSENAVTEYMKTHIFGDVERADRVVNSMRRQQGLLQLFHDYCESDTATCESCGFLAAVEGFGE
jgi:hypothetical protein